MEVDSLSRPGRSLLAYHCTGQDTVLGSVNVAGSIVLLLAIGFIAGGGVAGLFFWLRLRKERAYEIEYRERFGSQLKGEVPDVVSVMVKSAETPVFREGQHQQGQQHNITTCMAAMPEQPVAPFLPSATATLAVGPLAAGSTRKEAAQAQAAKPPHYPHPRHLSFQLDRSKEDYALRRAATLNGPLIPSASVPRPTGNPFWVPQDLDQMNEGPPLPPTSLPTLLGNDLVGRDPTTLPAHRRMASHHSLSLPSDLIPAHFGSEKRSTSVGTLSRSTSVLESPLASGLDASASVILAESHHRTMSAGPKDPRYGSAWGPFPRSSDSADSDAEDGVHWVVKSMNGSLNARFLNKNGHENDKTSIRRASSSLHATPNRSDMMNMGPLELAASITGLPLPLDESLVESYYTPIKSSMSTGGSSEYATPVATIESVHFAPQEPYMRQENAAPKHNSFENPEDAEYANPFATTPQSKAAHRAALSELKSSMQSSMEARNLEGILGKPSNPAEGIEEEKIEEAVHEHGVKGAASPEKVAAAPGTNRAEKEEEGKVHFEVVYEQDDAIEEEGDLEVGQPRDLTAVLPTAIEDIEKESSSQQP